VKALRKYAEELEAERDAPFDPKAAGILVPTAVERPEGRRGAGRKRLSDLHGSVTMRDVGGEAEKRRLEDEAARKAVEEKKRQRLEKKGDEEREAGERIAAFELCEHGCVCGVVPCPYAKRKRCPVCGPNSSVCKVRACVAARKPLLLGYNPVVGGQEEVQ
tara:strand:+ start:2324 stop:2806 length:483 start_codon:yes stop_codon:yes gene_type:complete